MKSYKNIIVLGVVAVGILIFLLIKYVSLSAILLQTGYYDQKISIANTADILGHLTYNERNEGDAALDNANIEMGMAQIAGIVDKVRQENPDTLFLDSGDMFSGTNEASVNQGEGIVEAANLMGLQAGGLGQHDFGWGYERIQEIKGKLKYPLLAANVFKDGKPAFDAYRIAQIGGKRIGIFGLTSDQFLQDLAIYDTKGVTYEDPVKIAGEVVKQLKEQKVDSIVLLSHIGDNFDKEEIAEHVEGIDLILSGRGFVLYKKADKVKNTYVAEAGAFGTHVGVADLYFKDGKVAKVEWRVEQSLDRSVENQSVAKVADKYRELALNIGKEVIGHTDVDLDGIRSHVRTKETNLTNLIADAMASEGHADLAIFNAGVIRESVPKGDITLYSIKKPLPYNNSLVTVEIKGALVYEAIEHGLETWPNGVHNGGFPQVSGITYTIDGSKPAGKRLVQVTKDGQPLDKDKLYKVAVTDYLVSGGDGYKMLEHAKEISRGALINEILAKYLKSKGGSIPGEEGRIQIINQRYK